MSYRAEVSIQTVICALFKFLLYIPVVFVYQVLVGTVCRELIHFLRPVSLYLMVFIVCYTFTYEETSSRYTCLFNVS